MKKPNSSMACAVVWMSQYRGDVSNHPHTILPAAIVAAWSVHGKYIACDHTCPCLLHMPRVHVASSGPTRSHTALLQYHTNGTAFHTP